VRRSLRYRCGLVGWPVSTSGNESQMWEGMVKYTFFSLSFSVFSSFEALAACRLSCLAVNYMVVFVSTTIVNTFGTTSVTNVLNVGDKAGLP
jgi:hypothetical protein